MKSFFLIFLALIILSFFVSTAVFTYLIYQRKKKSQSIWFLVIPLMFLLFVDSVISILLVDQISGGQTLLRSWSLQQIQHQQEALSQADNLSARAEEIGKYSECLLAAESDADMKKCEADVDPALLEQLKKNKNLPPQIMDSEADATVDLPAQSDCVKKYNACTDDCFKLSAEKQQACYAECEKQYSCK